MSQQPKKRKTWLIVVGGLLAVCCFGVVVVALLGGLASLGGDGEPLEPGVTPTPVPPAPSFAEIRQNHDTMTEAKWKSYRTKIEGKLAVEWHGWIDEVTGSSGRYKVMIDMDSPDDFLSYPEVSFVVPDEVALSLQIDQEIVFTGQIETIQDMLGSLDIDLEHATIVQ